MLSVLTTNETCSTYCSKGFNNKLNVNWHRYLNLCLKYDLRGLNTEFCASIVCVDNKIVGLQRCDPVQ